MPAARESYGMQILAAPFLRNVRLARSGAGLQGESYETQISAAPILRNVRLADDPGYQSAVGRSSGTTMTGMPAISASWSCRAARRPSSVSGATPTMRPSPSWQP